MLDTVDFNHVQHISFTQSRLTDAVSVILNGLLSYEHPPKSPEEQFQEAKNRYFRILADYHHLLMAWRKDYAPHSPEEAFHPRFVEALQKQDQVEYLLDVLLFGETEEKAALITDYGKDVIQLEQRMAELAAADAARTKKHHERHAAAPEH